MFTAVNPQTLTFTSSQQKVIDHVDALPYKADVSYAEVGDLAGIQSNGDLAFSIPGLSATVYTFYAEQVNYKNAVEYTWTGKIEGDLGDFVLYSDSTGKGGFIDLGAEFYSIYPLGGDLVLIMEHDLGEHVMPGCAGGGAASETEVEYCEEDDCGGAIVDVLVLVTEHANDWLDDNFGTFNQFYVWLGTNYMNSALILSGVPNKQIRIHVVWDYTPISQLIPTNITNGLDNLAFDQEQTGSLKFQYKADVVVMLTQEGFNDNGDGFAGLANSLDPDNNEKYCIVEVSYLLEPRYAFAHEVGHLFGCDHEPANASGLEEECAHGHLLELDGPAVRPTIMALTAATAFDDPAARILRYSNPDVEFDGKPTGITDERDNARILRASFCSVAENQPSPELGVWINGLPYLCGPGGDITGSNTWTANILAPGTGFPGVAPYAYAWYWSPDGILNTSNYLGSGSSVEVDQVYNCPAMWLHVVVTSDDDIVVVASFKIVTTLCDGCNSPRPGVAGTSQWQSHGSVLILPNPSDGKSTLNIRQLPEDVLSLYLYDQYGQQLREITVVGLKECQLNVSGLPGGSYFLGVLARSATTFQKIILQK